MAYTNIDDPSAYFQTVLWTGNASARSIVNDGNSDLQPDFIWYKCRDSNTAHFIQTSNYGVTKYFRPNLTSELSTASSLISSFDTDGFGMTSNSTNNVNGEKNVAWQWKANGNSTSSNTDGDITSTIQTNSTAGFTIGTYTGNGSNNQTIGHGLGAKPDWIIVKRKDTAAAWLVWHQGNTFNHVLRWYTNTETDSASGRVGAFGSQGSSTVFTVFSGGGAFDNCNINGDEYIFWAWTEKQGYSKFGSYAGNGNADGPFVYTGFAPAWLLIKGLNRNSNWNLYDNRRASTGGGFADRQDASRRLFPNNTEPESANTVADEMEFVSNGFKLRGTQASQNHSSGDYVYMAFAENPFVTSSGTPGTAR